MKFKSIILLGLFIFFITCTKENKSYNTTKYRIGIVKSGRASGYINVEGSIEVDNTKKVFVDKKLKVKEVYVKEGDYVEKNQLLMTFDNTERNNIIRNLKKEKLLLTKLKREYNIHKKLNKIGGSSDNEVIGLMEEIKVKKLSIDSLEEDLAKTTKSIKSPVSGTITKLTAQENYSVNTDEPLMEIADFSNIKIVLEVPEYDVQNIKLGQKLIIKPEVFEKKKAYNGKIIKISKISKISRETSENILEVEAAPEEKIPYIVPGFRVSATIYLNLDKKGLIIPKTAMLYKNNQYVIFVIDDNNKISEKAVTFSNMKGKYINVNSGLNGNEKYLIAPNNNLKSGMIVDVLEETKETEDEDFQEESE